MRPVLVSVGPWSHAVLPLVLLVMLGLLLLWQGADRKYAGGPKLSWMRLGVLVAISALLTLTLFAVVNRFAPLEVKAWGTFLVLAFSAGTFFMARWPGRRELSPGECVDVALWALVGAIIGSRLVFVALDWQLYADHPLKLLNVWEGGLSFHGGLLGAILAGILYARAQKKNFWAIADQTAPGIALGYAFARMGCFLNGCCHGHPCNLPWAMVFPKSDMPTTPVHPTQLYSIVMSLIILTILVKIRKRLPHPGHVFGAYLILYSLGRFCMEISRSGATGKIIWLGWLTIGQLTSVLIIVGVGLLMWLTGRKPLPADASSGEATDGGSHRSSKP